MDFNDTPEEATFRAEVRNWLAANAQEFRQPLPATLSLADYSRLGRAWQKKKAAVGYGSIMWSKAHGGLDGTPMQEVIFHQEESKYHVPIGPFVGIGVNLAVPTIRAHGTPEQIEQFARPTLLGDICWCQLFSEPAAGSDLAGLRTRAIKDGDDWILNGQKVWTSWAQTADWGILIARTDPDVPKHKGLTFFVVDMKTPGIDVRPIRQISGESEFSEVFLTDVRIPDSNRLGKIGDGWKCAMTTLMNERSSSGAEKVYPTAHALVGLLNRNVGGSDVYRMEIARLFAQEEGLKYFKCRQLTSLGKGETPGAIAAMGKLVYANNLQDSSTIGMELLAQATAPEDKALLKNFEDGYVWSSAMRIAGGADEILRNQIAERVLGMPGDIRVDKDVPFSQIPIGGA